MGLGRSGRGEASFFFLGLLFGLLIGAFLSSYVIGFIQGLP